MNERYLLYFLSLLLMASCTNKDIHEQAIETPPIALEGELTISGADALHPLMQVWADEFVKEHPGLRISVSSGGTGKGIDQVREGSIDLAMVSRKLSPGEESLGLIYFPVSREAVIPIASSKNPHREILMTRGIRHTELSAVYTRGEDLTWGNLLKDKSSLPINLYTRADLSGAAEIWSAYLGIRYSDLAGIEVSGDEGMIYAVSTDSLAVGFCNAHYAYDFLNHRVKDGLMIIPLDFNENGRIDPREKVYDSLCCMQRAVYLGTFPSHLCREMALVTDGRPQAPAIIELLKWICKDGQAVAKANGYPELRQYIIRDNLSILEGKKD